MWLSWAYHLPELIRSWQLDTGPLHNKGLLANSPVLQLVLDVGEPWLGAPGVSLDVLLVGEVVLGLRIESAISMPACWKGKVAIPPAPGLAGDRMPERGWMTSRDAMFLVSLDSDCCASVARDVESGKERQGKSRSCGALARHHCCARDGEVSRDGERGTASVVGSWRSESSRRRDAFFFSGYGLRMVRPFRRLGANRKRTQGARPIIGGYFSAGLVICPTRPWKRMGPVRGTQDSQLQHSAHHCSDHTAKLTWKLHHHRGSRPAKCQHLQASAAPVHHIPSFPSI